MNHWWSGWPGAYCFHCFSADPMEIAIANNLYDCDTDKWESLEAKEQYEKSMVCPGPVQHYCPCPECRGS